MTKCWRTVLLTGVMTSVFLTGCMGKIKYPTYYTLNLAPPADPPLKGGALPSIAVREFGLPPICAKALSSISPRQRRSAFTNIIDGL